jgi:phage virion morphogenesis protein
MIRIDIDDREVRAALANLQRRVADLTPVMHDIGQALVKGMRARLRDGRDVEGRPFAPNKPTTLAKKRGTRPLVDSGMMADQFAYQAGRDFVEAGSNAEQAATLHFGAKRGAHGKTRRGAPIPWGDIPARPFVGLSKDDKEAVLETIAEAIERAAQWR